MPGTLANTVENSLERQEQQSTFNRSMLPSRFHKKEENLTLQQALEQEHTFEVLDTDEAASPTSALTRKVRNDIS